MIPQLALVQVLALALALVHQTVLMLALALAPVLVPGQAQQPPPLARQAWA